MSNNMKIFQHIIDATGKDDPISGAEHDIIFLNADNEDIDPESDLGKTIDELGAFYDSSHGCWCLFV